MNYLDQHIKNRLEHIKYDLRWIFFGNGNIAARNAFFAKHQYKERKKHFRKGENADIKREYLQWIEIWRKSAKHSEKEVAFYLKKFLINTYKADVDATVKENTELREWVLHTQKTVTAQNTEIQRLHNEIAELKK